MARLSGLSAREDRVDDHLPRAQAGAAGTAGAANKVHASEPGARAAKMPRALRTDVRFGVEWPPHVPRLPGPRRAHRRRQRHFRPAQQARQRRRAVVSGSRAATGGDGGKHSKNCATEWTGGARVLRETEFEHIPGAARRSLGIRKIAEVGRRAQESPRAAPLPGPECRKGHDRDGHRASGLVTCP